MEGFQSGRIPGIKTVVTSGMLIALALLFSYLERLVPISVIVPIPGIKLGLANIVTMVALFHMGIRTSASITVLRCVLANMLFGTAVSLIFSLSGAFLALAVMVALKAGHERYFSIIGISVAGAAAHNIGQLAAASLAMKSMAVMTYLPMLLVASILTGFATGTVAQSLIRMIDAKRIKLFNL